VVAEPERAMGCETDQMLRDFRRRIVVNKSRFPLDLLLAGT
jgi:hypothetical protein